MKQQEHDYYKNDNQEVENLIRESKSNSKRNQKRI